MNFESRLANLERRMESYESMKKKRKADVLVESDVDEVEEDVSAAESGAGGAGGEDVGDSEEILKGVLRHSKPSGEFEWARKQINLAQTDPADLDQYFTALVAALVVQGYLDSYTAWLNRFVAPAPASGVLKGRAVEAYVSKNLLMLLNLQPLSRGRKAKEDGLATLKKRSTYEKVLECARAVSRGEALSYEPSPAALQLITTTPKKNAGGRKKKLATAATAAVTSEVEAEAEEVEDDAEEAEEVEEEAEDDDEDVFTMPLGKGKGPLLAMMASIEAEREAEAAAAVEEEKDASEEAVEEAVEEAAEEDAEATQAQMVTQVPVVEMEKVDLFSMPSSSSSSAVGVAAALPSSSSSSLPSSSSSLRSRFMAKKIVSTAVSPAAHPMVQESPSYEWEPLDVNRRSMVMTAAGAWGSYLNWRQAFEADPRFENRYTEYTRPNGERSSLTGYYVRFFSAWPTIVSGEDVASMAPQKADSMYVRWLQSLSTTKTVEVIRERLL